MAARGLDYPNIDWVIQFDCPEDVDTYVHRVGRTARYTASGQSLLLLNESEVAMIEKLKKKGAQLTESVADPSKMQDIALRLQSNVAAEPKLKYLAQRAFIGYARSIHMRSDKDVFNVHELPLKEYCESLGVISVPKIRFRKTSEKKNVDAEENKEEDEDEEKAKQEDEEVEEEEEEEAGGKENEDEDQGRKEGQSLPVQKRAKRSKVVPPILEIDDSKFEPLAFGLDEIVSIFENVAFCFCFLKFFFATFCSLRFFFRARAKRRRND